MSADLELQAVRKVYENGVTAVAGIDLRVSKGEFVSFVGPSGCGKTTTLRMIAGFEAITEGNVLIGGSRVNDLPPERRPTSTIFQNFALFPHMTVRRNIEYGLAARGVPKAERTVRADAIMEKLDLTAIAGRREAGLSGGQRQRVALARSLVVEPQILLLDEPLGALDANLRKTIQHELKLLQRTLGITFIFVTHAQSEALSLSDRIVVMNRGHVEQVSPPVELYTRPRTLFVARFIGRNTVIGGRIDAIADGIAAVDTRYGRLYGTINDRTLRPGAPAGLVIPSEAFDVALATASDQQPHADTAVPYSGPAPNGPAPNGPAPNGPALNGLAGRIVTADVVAHTVFLTVALDDGREIALESHVAKYEPALTTRGAAVRLQWSTDEATVIGPDDPDAGP